MKIRIQFFYAILGLCFFAFSYTHAKRRLELDNSIILTGQMPDENSIEFQITAPKLGWVALGFGNQIKDSSMFIVSSNDENTTLHYGYNPKTQEVSSSSENPYSLKVNNEGEYNVYTVTRNLTTQTQDDHQIINGEHEMVYAYGIDSKNIDYRLGNEGQLIMAVNEKLRIVRFDFPSTNEHVKRRNLAGGGDFVHGILSYLAWCIFTLALVVTGRYAKYFYITRNWIHSVLGTIVFILTIIVVAVTPSSEDNMNGFGSAHKGIGGILVIPTIIVWVIGGIVKVLQVVLRQWTHLAIWSRYVHQYAGYAWIIWANAIFLSGLYLYGVPVLTYLYYIHLAACILSFVAIEVLFQLKNKWHYLDLKVLEDMPLKQITLEQFDQMIKDGKKYCLMDDYVLDVSYYRWEHPGSTYVIDMTIGKDIGKYFYGSYSLEDMVKPYTHSYIAGKVVKHLVCAKIVDPKAKEIVVPKHALEETNNIAEQILSHTNSYTVIEKIEIMKDVYRFKLANNKNKFKSYYQNLDFSGRGYIINSPQWEVSRYYTIWNWMNGKYYDIYMDAFDSVLKGGMRNHKLSSNEKIHEDYDDFIEFIIKVYHQTKTGVAKQLWNAEPNQKFYMDGPMGKELDFDLPNPDGTYLLFVGGTGILPYMDIFAYMVRKLIAERNNEGSIFPGENFDIDLNRVKFIVYAYYQNQENACGYEFTKKVADVFKKYGVEEQFQFYPKFTRSGDKRLDKKSLLELLRDYKDKGGVKRVWVCGPPPMNNMFTKYTKSVIKTLGISKNQIDIL